MALLDYHLSYENGTAKLSTKEEMLIDKILKKWEDYRRGK